jgi:O-antigen/teichoic acid export membrane protein
MSLAKSVFGGTAVISAAGGLARIFTVAAAPLLTALLGPTPYGVAALAGTVVSLATTLALFGIDMSYARFSFGGEAAEGARIERFSWRIALASSVLASLAVLIAWRFLLAPQAGVAVGLGGLVAAAVLLSVMAIMSQTRIRLQRNYRRIALAQVIAGGLGTLATLSMAAFWRHDAVTLLLGTLLVPLVTIGLLGLPPLSALAAPSGLNAQERRRIVALGIPCMVSAPMFWVLSSLDRWFLNGYCGQETVGVYSFVYNLATVGTMLNSALTLVWFPEAANRFEEDPEAAGRILGRLWERLVVMLMLVWLLVAMTGGDLVRLLADARFHGGTRYVPWLAGGMFFYGVSSLANTGLLLAKRMQPVAWWWLVGGVVSVTFNALFIPRFGAGAAAVTGCASFALIAVGVMVASQRTCALTISWARVGLAGAVIGAAGTLCAGPWQDRPLLSLCLKLPAAVAIAAGIMRLTAPDWYGRLVQLVLARGVRAPIKPEFLRHNESRNT